MVDSYREREGERYKFSSGILRIVWKTCSLPPVTYSIFGGNLDPVSIGDLGKFNFVLLLFVSFIPFLTFRSGIIKRNIFSTTKSDKSHPLIQYIYIHIEYFSFILTKPNHNPYIYM